MIKILSTVVLLFVIQCTGSKNSEFKRIAVAVIADTTDRINVTISSKPLLQLYELDKVADNEALFRFKVIKNVKLVPVTTYHLPPTTEYESKGDPQAHNRAVLNFYSLIDKTIDSFQLLASKSKELANSECFFAIAEELSFLAQLKYDKKVLIVVSNLFEKSFTDVYNHEFSSDEFYEILGKNSELGELNGIEIYFVFNPEQDRKADWRFRIIVMAYKKFLENRGALVHIQATADNFIN
jgi:hypothetical protein